MGREPFDEGVRRALEAQNPDVTFDWPTILDAPIPSADADKWRERRRAERAARHSAVAANDPELGDEAGEPIDAEPPTGQPPLATDEEQPDASALAGAPSSPPPPASDGNKKRRRRRRGRRTAAPAQTSHDNRPEAIGEPAQPDEPGDPTGD